jgi:hypothetical protein
MLGNPQATDREDVLQTFSEALCTNGTTPEKVDYCDSELEENSINPLDESDESM